MFGYYDRCAWDPLMRYHLALHIPQHHHLPRPGETAEVGLVDMRGDFAFRPIARTRAWNHQQGSMTLFFLHDPDRFCFNDFDETGNGVTPATRIYHLEKGLLANWPFHFYCLSPDGRWGVSLDFSRITRRGYSYADAVADPEVLMPKDEGVWLVDVARGERSLICAYEDLIASHPIPWEVEGKFLWLNHAIFNCDSSRLMVLLRYYLRKDVTWQTYLYTMKLDGSDLQCSLPDNYWHTRHGGVSHQIWGRTPREILIDAGWAGQGNECVVFREDQWPLRAERLSPGQREYAHLVFSPDCRWIASHSYPVKNGVQKFALVRVSDGAVFDMGSFGHKDPECAGDTRCDLHARWSPDSTKVTVDSIDSGFRKIYMLDLNRNEPR